MFWFIILIFWILCDVLNLLKKFINGILDFIVVKCVILFRFIIFWIEFLVSIVNFVCLVVIIFWWFLKIFSEDVVNVLVVIWIIYGNIFFVILYILGIISSKFCDVV